MSDQDDRLAGEVGDDDEQALRAMFAALVEDAAPSELSLQQVQRVAGAERRAGRDSRRKRLSYARGALIAAVLVGVVALVVPRLGTGASTASSGSSSKAAAPVAAAGAAGSASNAAPAASSAAASGAAAGSAFAVAGGGTLDGGGTAGDRTPLGAGERVPSAGAASSGSANSAFSGDTAAGAGTPASEAMSSGAASTGPMSAAPEGLSSAAASAAVPGCVPLSQRWFPAVGAALPGYRGAVRITSCTSQIAKGSGPGTVTLVVSTASLTSCAGASGGGCQPVPGTQVAGATGAYSYGSAVTVVGADHLAVTVTTTPGGPDRAALIAAARALLKTAR